MIPSIDWLVSLNNLAQIWEDQPSLLISQSLYVLGGLCTLKHATSNGGHWPLLWLVIILNGLEIELITSFLPENGHFWHSQGPVMLFNKTLPLPILFLYPCMYYISMVSASLLKISRFYESLAVGFLTLLIDLPCDFIGIKYLHWSWHNTDPDILERNYSVPWTSYIFHFLFSATINYLFKTVISICKKNEPLRSKQSKQRRWKLIFVNLLLPIPIVLLVFSLGYHYLHESLGLHSQTIFTLMLSISAGQIWSACCLESSKEDLDISRTGRTKIIAFKYIVLYLFLHYSFFLSTPVLFDPEKQISNGFHQPIGPCNVTESVYTILGKKAEREKYLCWANHGQEYFDFHCVPNFVPENGAIVPWYTICGTPFENKTEYMSIMFGITVVSFYIFRTIFDSKRYSNINERERKRV